MTFTVGNQPKSKSGFSWLHFGIGMTLAIAASPGGAASVVYLPSPVYETDLHAHGSDFSGARDAVQRVGDPYAGFSANHYHPTGPLTLSVQNHRESYCCGFDTHASSSTSNAGGGSVNVSSSSNNDSADAWARMAYYFTLTGPDAAYVDLVISGFGFAEQNSASKLGTAGSEFMVRYTDPATGFHELTDAFGNHERGAFSETIRIKPNIDYYSGAPEIILTAFTSSGTTGEMVKDVGYGGAGRAYIDPIFSFADPALASLYTLVGVPRDALLPSTVPEPASWTMMVGGFGLLGVAMRRRRRTVPLAKVS
jgi:MYXO-CTERM domain-containing protein